jgi:hypothetical protein
MSCDALEDGIAGEKKRVEVQRALGHMRVRCRNGQAFFPKTAAELPDMDPMGQRRPMYRDTFDQVSDSALLGGSPSPTDQLRYDDGG